MHSSLSVAALAALLPPPPLPLAPTQLPAELQDLPRAELPRHIAVIMDGNARWARCKQLSSSMDGHRAGVGALRTLVSSCAALDGVEELTVFALSTENWSRPTAEVAAILQLVETVLREDMDALLTHGVRLRFIGSLERLPRPLRSLLHAAAAREPARQRLLLSVALSYGGRSEMARATREICERVLAGEIETREVDEELLTAHLHGSAASVPSDPDLLIRTGGQHRLSKCVGPSPEPAPICRFLSAHGAVAVSSSTSWHTRSSSCSKISGLPLIRPRPRLLRPAPA